MISGNSFHAFITGTEFNTCTSVHRSLRQTRYEIFLMFKKQNLVVEQRLVVIYYMYHIECHVKCHECFAVNKKRVACLLQFLSRCLSVVSDKPKRI
jgi:hypothetical protein